MGNITMVNKANCVEVARKIVGEHYKDLVLTLGIEDIQVLVIETGRANYVLGSFSRCTKRDEHQTYIHSKSHVEIYALSIVRGTLLSCMGSIAFALVNPICPYPEYEKLVIETLAHELRHVYQATYRIHHCDNRVDISDNQEYLARKSEIDARAWSENYAIIATM